MRMGGRTCVEHPQVVEPCLTGEAAKDDEVEVDDGRAVEVAGRGRVTADGGGGPFGAAWGG